MNFSRECNGWSIGILGICMAHLLASCQPTDRTETMTSVIREVGGGVGSTSFGYYNTSPESPDGSHIAFIRYLQEPQDSNDGQPAELWICDADLRNHRRVCGIPLARPHNGAEVLWVDGATLAFSTPWRYGPAPRTLRVVDVNTGLDRLAPLTGISDFGHTAHNGSVLFATDSRVKNSAFGQAGIYELNARTTTIRSILSLERLADCLPQLPHAARDAQGRPVADWKTWVIYHLMHSPNGKRIAFRFDVGTVKLLATMNADGGNVRIFEESPLHFLWYDDDSLIGHDRRRSHQLVRYSFDGERLETLSALPGNHLAVSLDRNDFVSESSYNSDPVILKWYRSGDNQPRQILASFSPVNVVWGRQFHTNPSFSRDGKRVYFHMPRGDYNGTFVVQLNNVVKNHQGWAMDKEK